MSALTDCGAIILGKYLLKSDQTYQKAKLPEKTVSEHILIPNAQPLIYKIIHQQMHF